MKPSQRTSHAITAAFSLIILLIGLWSLLPRSAISPQESDGIEYAVAALTKTILHQPGYPLYGRISRFLVNQYPANPYATLATFSAVCQSLAAIFIFLALMQLGSSQLLAFALTIGWFLQECSLRTGTDAEVFGMHHLLISVLLFVLLAKEWRSKYYSCWVFIAGALFGLAASHHQTVILWTPLVLSAIVSFPGTGSVWHRKGTIFAKMMLFTLGVSIGLTPYLLLLGERSGIFQAPHSIYDLIQYVLRTSYGTLSFRGSGDISAVNYLGHFSEMLLINRALLLTPLVLLPYFALFKNERLAWGLILTALTHLWFLSKLSYLSPPELFSEWIERFYPLVFLYLTVATGYCIRLALVPKTILSLLVITWSAWPQGAFTGSDARNDLVMGHTLSEISEELPERSVFFTNEDWHRNGLRYLALTSDVNTNQKIISSLNINSKLVEQLAQTIPELANSKIQNYSDLATAVYQSEFRLFSTLETPPPVGFVKIVKGVLVEWVPSNRTLSKDRSNELQSRFCKALSSDLIVPRQRKISRWIVGIHYINPLKYVIGETPDGPRRDKLQNILNSFLRGDLLQLKALCEETISMHENES